MFKKKSNLPLRPKYPSADQIVSDLSSAPNNDPVFTTSRAIVEKKSKQESMPEEDVAYEKVKKLFKLHDTLQENMQNLELMRTKLNQKKEDVNKLSDELKSQALKALV